MPPSSYPTSSLYMAAGYHNPPDPEAVFKLPSFLCDLLGIEESETPPTARPTREGLGMTGVNFQELSKKYQRGEGIYMPRPIHHFGHRIAFWEGHELQEAEAQQASWKGQEDQYPIIDRYAMDHNDLFCPHVGYDYSFTGASLRMGCPPTTIIPQARYATTAPSTVGVEYHNLGKAVPLIRTQIEDLSVQSPRRRRYYRYSDFMVAPSTDELPSL